MQGDEVLVDEALPGRDGRRSGRVARVLTRRNPTVVGIFHYARGHRRNAWDDIPMIHGNYVTPLDERMTQPILIAEGMEVPALPRETPHRVLGEEAQTVQAHWEEEVNPLQPLEGLAVDVEITDFPGPGRRRRDAWLRCSGRRMRSGWTSRSSFASIICACVSGECVGGGYSICGADGRYAGCGRDCTAKRFSRAADCDH